MIDDSIGQAPAVATAIESRQGREQLAAMIRELQINRVLLEGLLHRYRVFRFTGGSVPSGPRNLAALTSYLKCPFACDRISPVAIERYRHLTETIMNSGQAIKGDGRPRSLRCRYDITARFDRDYSEILPLGSTIESAMATLVDELQSSPAETGEKQ
ncbi:MAG TPA: hypothetical protein VKU82_10255 [Planctomycetaceae bacterium]|nr:hypothetical protein [Planctomycetaceae bacterium]